MKRSFFLTTGLALFAMFFGAGNLVFPLKIGHESQNSFLIAISGFSLTAIIAPILGFFAMMLYEGNWRSFFAVIGKTAGFILMATILLVVGPCGAIPRCVALSSAAVQTLFPSISLQLFSALSCCLVFFLTFRENNVVDVIAKLLTPFKLLTLGVLMIAGTVFAQTLGSPTTDPLELFFNGMQEGLHTLDLPSALMFSSFLYPTLRSFSERNAVPFWQTAAKVGAVCTCAFVVIYGTFSFISAGQQTALDGVPRELLLMKLSHALLGSYGSIFTMILIFFACLTTEVALTAIFAEFLKKELFKEKLSYTSCLAITIVLTYFFAITSFSGIVTLLAPVLVISYPLLIALCVVNIVKKWRKHALQTVS